MVDFGEITAAIFTAWISSRGAADTLSSRSPMPLYWQIAIDARRFHFDGRYYRLMMPLAARYDAASPGDAHGFASYLIRLPFRRDAFHHGMAYRRYQHVGDMQQPPILPPPLRADAPT